MFKNLFKKGSNLIFTLPVPFELGAMSNEAYRNTMLDIASATKDDVEKKFESKLAKFSVTVVRDRSAFVLQWKYYGDAPKKVRNYVVKQWEYHCANRV